MLIARCSCFRSLRWLDPSFWRRNQDGGENKRDWFPSTFLDSFSFFSSCLWCPRAEKQIERSTFRSLLLRTVLWCSIQSREWGDSWYESFMSIVEFLTSAHSLFLHLRSSVLSHLASNAIKQNKSRESLSFLSSCFFVPSPLFQPCYCPLHQRHSRSALCWAHR